MTDEERFWGRVEKGSGCWIWTRRDGCPPRKRDYGMFVWRGRPTGAHRVAWELTNGAIPKGLWVLHRCDNPPCVRPDHLFLGTVGDNMKDRAEKGRDPATRLRHDRMLSNVNSREGLIVGALPLPDGTEAALLTLFSSLESMDSRRGYRADWRRWCEWLRDRGVSAHEAEVTHVQAYLISMNKRGLAKATRARALAVLRGVYSALARAQVVDENPAREAKNIRVRSDPRTPWLTDEELKALLRKPEARRAYRTAWIDRRDWLVVATLIGTGLRRNEVANLRFEWILPGPTGGVATKVIVKGGSEGFVLFPAWLAKEILAWRKQHTEGPLFPSRKGGNEPISAITVWRIVKQAAKRVGVDPRRATPHALRRSFVTLTGQRGVSIEDRQAALLHVNRATTERYDKAAGVGRKAPGEVLGDLLEDEEH